MKVVGAIGFLALTSVLRLPVGRADAPPGYAQWVATFGAEDTFAPLVQKMATDPAGNTYLALQFTGSIDFGAGLMTAPDDANAVGLAKFDAAGHLLWAHVYGSGSINFAFVHSMALTPSGGLVLGSQGDFRVGLDFGCGAPSTTVAIAILDADGDCIKNIPLGGELQDNGTWHVVRVAVDPAGNLAVAALISGTVTIGQLSFQSSTPSSMVLFLPSMDPDRASVLQVPSNGFVSALATEATGEVWFAGSYTDTLALGSQPPITSTSVTGASFIARMRGADARVRWLRSIDGFAQVATMAVVPSSGRAVVAGLFGGTLTFGTSITNPDPGQNHLYLLEAASDGSPRGLTQIAATVRVLDISNVTIDSRGDVTVGFDMLEKGYVQVGNKIYTNGTSDAALFVARFGPSLASVLWSRDYGIPGNYTLGALASSDGDHLTVGGTFANRVNLGPDHQVDAPFPGSPGIVRSGFIAAIRP